jgi:hypothetical protein
MRRGYVGGEYAEEKWRAQSFVAPVAGPANNDSRFGPGGNRAAVSPVNVATDPEFPGDASDALERSMVLVLLFVARVLAIKKDNTVRSKNADSV